MPMMPFNGVRISWLMLATNSLLARLAASAASLASRKRDLGAAPLGDVPGEAKRPHQLALVVAQRQFRRGDPRDAAVGPGFLLLQLEHRFTGLHEPHFVGPGLRRMFLREEIEIRLADRVGRIDAVRTAAPWPGQSAGTGCPDP